MRRILSAILLLVFSYQLSARDTLSNGQQLTTNTHDKLSIAKQYYDSAFHYLTNNVFLSALPMLIKTAELVEGLPEDMSDEEMHLTSRAYYQMGNVFGNLFMNSYEIEAFHRAAQYQDMRQDSTWMLYTKVALAKAHQIVFNNDSVDYYLEQIIPLSDSINHFLEYHMTLHLIARNLYDRKEYDTAFYLMKERIKLKNRHNEPTIGDSISLGILMYHSPYMYQSKPYLLKMFETPPGYRGNLGLPAVLLAELYEEEGNNDSLAICNKYMPAFVRDLAGNESEKIDVELMYENFKTERDKRLYELRLQKEKIKNRNIAIYSVLTLLILSIVIIVIMTKKKNKELSDMQITDDTWKFFEQSELVQRIKSKLATDNGEKINVKNIEKYSDRNLTTLEFIELRAHTDKTFNGFISRLAEQYPDLTQKDIYYCCLSMIGLTNSEIAVLFGLTYNAISIRISKVKKTFNTDENIRDFLIKEMK